MKSYIMTIIFASVFVLGCKEDTGEAVQLITVEEMKSLMQMDDIQLIDVRSKEEYADGHIKNAKNIVFLGDNWEEDIEQLDKEKPVLVYCEKGGRSARCAKELVKAGFTKIYDLDGGIAQWKFKGEAVE